jgi:HAMP domain-containing protein
MWYYIVGGISVVLVSLFFIGKWSMKFAWEQRKRELEELKIELEQMEELTDELKLKRDEIEELLNNEFKDYSALFKPKINIE